MIKLFVNDDVIGLLLSDSGRDEWLYLLPVMWVGDRRIERGFNYVVRTKGKTVDWAFDANGIVDSSYRPASAKIQMRVRTMMRKFYELTKKNPDALRLMGIADFMRLGIVVEELRANPRGPSLVDRWWAL